MHCRMENGVAPRFTRLVSVSLAMSCSLFPLIQTSICAQSIPQIMTHFSPSVHFSDVFWPHGHRSHLIVWFTAYHISLNISNYEREKPNDPPRSVYGKLLGQNMVVWSVLRIYRTDWHSNMFDIRKYMLTATTQTPRRMKMFMEDPSYAWFALNHVKLRHRCDCPLDKCKWHFIPSLRSNCKAWDSASVAGI